MGFVCRLAVATAALAFAWTPARPAAACSCISPGFELITPAPGQLAPLNTRIRVTYVQSWNRAVTVVLRSEDGRQIPASASTASSGQVRVVELVPEANLEPEARYEVRTIETGPPQVETVVGVFATGTGEDVAAPQWRGVRRAVLVGNRASRAAQRPGRRAESSCARPAPYAVLTAPPASDRDTPASSLLYAVWLPGAEGGPDTSRPPSAFVAAENGRIALGSSNSCDPRQFSFARRGRLRVGVAAVDPAGNQSAPVLVGLGSGRVRRRATE